MTDDEATVRRLYDGFNRRDVSAVLAMLDEAVEWANGMDGGHEHGREAVRAYWTRQWAAIQPRVAPPRQPPRGVDPLRIARRVDGATTVEVHQVVRDLAGALLLDETVCHVFRFEDGLVTRFDIETAGGLSSIAHR